MVREKIVCPVCGRDDFKTPQGLSGHVRQKHQQELSEVKEEVVEERPTSLVKRGQYSLEETIRDLVVPEIADGNTAVFQDGIQFGVRSILVGVRVAQELSKMGVQQASPIIQMAKEMRESEGEAAKTVAAELAQATLEGNREIIGAINQLNVTSQAGSADPMMRMISRMQAFPQMMGAMQGLMSMMGMNMGQQGQQGQTQSFNPAGSPQQATDRDIEEAFGE